MNELFNANNALNTLRDYLKDILTKSNSISTTPKAEPKSQKITDDLNPEQLDFKKNRAAKIIQHAWRTRKIKQQMIENPYGSYLSMIGKEDEQYLLSNIMFGRHVAEFRKTSKNRTQNPYIHTDAFYHRDDNLSGILLDSLLKKFNIPEKRKEEYLFIPITVLKNMPLQEILNKYFKGAYPAPLIIKGKDDSIDLLAVPKLNNPKLARIKSVIKACGLVASPWEIAGCLKLTPLTPTPAEAINTNATLPDTKEKLLNSKIFGKLQSISRNPDYTTNKLAASLIKLLVELPALDSKAIQRIALMLDMTNTFYENNYPRYAFCLYAIIHEISLSLQKNSTQTILKRDFNEFIKESRQTLLHALDLSEKQLDKVSFIATPAISGTNAYATAMKLASTMQTKTGKAPVVKVYKPNYYEFDYITETTHSAEADIFVISAGPIVNLDGLTPGIDINRFVKRTIIDPKRDKPATVIIDATTALYKNIHLNPEVQALVAQGKLSIIIQESHQKFGLLHSDQAQYGRVFGLCSKESYATEVLQEMQDNAQDDFNHHVDMRIGAFISSRCGETLEDIKQQHFSNGALLRNILTQSTLATAGVVTHEDMLTNLDELYFVTSDVPSLTTASNGIVEARDSFGHFSSCRAKVGSHLRISADASDNIDCLIQTTQIYLAQHYTPQKLLGMLIENARKSAELSAEEQIMSLALLNNIAGTIVLNPVENSSHSLASYAAMEHLLERCPFLKGRQYYSNVSSYLFKAQSTIIAAHKPANAKDFINAVKTLYRHGITVDDQMTTQLKDNNQLCQVIVHLKSIAMNEQLIKSLIDAPKQLALIHKNRTNVIEVMPLINHLHNAHLTITAELLAHILSNKDSQAALKILINKNISLNNIIVSSLINNPSFSKFVLAQEDSRSAKQIAAAAALAATINPCDDYFTLTKSEKLCDALLKIHQTNEEILSSLKKAPEKYSAAKKHTPLYLEKCYKALYQYSQHVESPRSKHTLIESLDNARNKYNNEVLAHDRSPLSQAGRWLLKGLSNFVAAFTFGLAHYLHYKYTGRVSFFSGTDSMNKLNSAHKELSKELSETNQNTDESAPENQTFDPMQK